MSAQVTDVERRYLQMLPRIDAAARYHHAHLDPEKRDEAIAETRAWSWAWCRSAAEKGRLERVTPTSLASYAARMFRSGRRFAGSNSTDALSPQTRVEREVAVMPLEWLETAREASTAEALADSRHTNPFHIARVDIDYAHALEDPRLPDRAGEFFGLLVQDSSLGCMTWIAETMGLSKPRISQLKQAVGGALARIGYGPSQAAVA